MALYFLSPSSAVCGSSFRCPGFPCHSHLLLSRIHPRILHFLRGIPADHLEGFLVLVSCSALRQPFHFRSGCFWGIPICPPLSAFLQNLLQLFYLFVRQCETLQKRRQRICPAAETANRRILICFIEFVAQYPSISTARLFQNPMFPFAYISCS